MVRSWRRFRISAILRSNFRDDRGMDAEMSVRMMIYVGKLMIAKGEL